MADYSHKEIVELFKDSWEADRDNREDALEDLRFLAGDQWEAFARDERLRYSKPTITINRMGGFVRQVTGDMRLNPISLNVLPVDDESDSVKAEIMEGMIRHIDHHSNGINAYAHAFECAAGIGIGHFRFNTRYVRDSVTDQEITVERIFNPLAVVWDPAATKIDRSDANYCFVTSLMPRRAFKKKYPNASVTGFDRETDWSTLYWSRDDSVRVCEFWCKKPYKRTLALLRDGSTVDITKLGKTHREFLPIEQTREFEDYKIEQTLLSGDDFLTDYSDWAGSLIPIVPVMGQEIPLDEKTVRHGIVRWAKDPQRMYNYMRSSQAEVVGQQPRSPYLVTAKMIKGYEAHWNTANTNPRPYLPYKPDPEAPGAAPKRELPPAMSQAFAHESAMAAEDMKSATGIYDASLGAKSNETSGKAIMARQREGDVGSYIYTDNFKSAMHYAGQVIVDLLPKIYDTQRVIRVVGSDDETKLETINEAYITPDGYEEVANDISVGRFDVRVVAGPSFSTKREEARESMTTILQGNPALFGIAGDLFIKALDIPYGEEIAERIKKTMPPGLVEDENQPQQPDPMQQAEIEARQRAQMVEEEKSAAEIQKLQADTENLMAKTKSVEIDNLIKAGEQLIPSVQDGYIAQ